MKKQLITLTALAGFAMGASMAYGAYNESTGSSAGGGIVGSKHNMNLFLSAQTKPGDDENRVCAYCHTPHHALGTGDTVAIVDASGNTGYDDGTGTIVYNVYSPLWSRDFSKMKATYDPYVSATFNPTQDGVGQAYDNLIGPSRLCMSCHDGIVAADAYYGDPGTAGISGDDTLTMFGSGNFGIGKEKDLANDHPIGFKYADYLNDLSGKYELRPIATKFPKAGETDLSGTGKSIESVLWTDSTSGIAGADAFMTCASCHDVHNGPAVGNTAPATAKRGYFLLGTQNNSYFCLTCHDKNK